MVKFRPPLTWIHLYIWWMSIWTFACTSPFMLHYMSVHRHFILLPCHTSLLLVFVGCKSIYSLLPHQMYSKLISSTTVFKEIPYFLLNSKQFLSFIVSLHCFISVVSWCTAQNSDPDCVSHRTREQHLWLWNPCFTCCRPKHTMFLVPGTFPVPPHSLPLLCTSRIMWELSIWTIQPQNMIQANVRFGFRHLELFVLNAGV